MSDLRIDIVGAYSRYTDDVQKKIKRAVRQIGEEMRLEAIERSPVGTGNYKSGWIRTIVNKNGHIKAVVRNKIYQLPHLQECPHYIGRREQGRRYPGADGGAVGVIREINKKYSDKLNEKIEEIIS